MKKAPNKFTSFKLLILPPLVGLALMAFAQTKYNLHIVPFANHSIQSEDGTKTYYTYYVKITGIGR